MNTKNKKGEQKMVNPKLIENGKCIKVNNKFIRSIGHFAYDGCHKIYILEDLEDLQLALNCGYYIYPIEKLRQTYKDSCELKFIDTWKLTNGYVRQDEKASWKETKATKKDLQELKDFHLELI